MMVLFLVTLPLYGKTVIQSSGKTYRVNCPGTVKVEVDTFGAGREWETTPVDAHYLNAAVSKTSPAWATCTYEAYGSKFMIKKRLDKPYYKCTSFVQQGGTGGVSCK